MPGRVLEVGDLLPVRRLVCSLHGVDPVAVADPEQHADRLRCRDGQVDPGPPRIDFPVGDRAVRCEGAEHVVRVQARYGGVLPGPHRVHGRRPPLAAGSLGLSGQVLEPRPVHRCREQDHGRSTPPYGDRADGVEQRPGGQPAPRVGCPHR